MKYFKFLKKHEKVNSAILVDRTKELAKLRKNIKNPNKRESVLEKLYKLNDSVQKDMRTLNNHIELSKKNIDVETKNITTFEANLVIEENFLSAVRELIKEYQVVEADVLIDNSKKEIDLE